MATYKVESVQTGYYIISNGEERHGNVVSSYNSNQGVPSDTDLTFNFPVQGPEPLIVTIKGKAGLYIGYNPESPIGRLLWVSESDPNTEWWVAQTGDAYRFYPKNGANLYWYLNASSQGYVGIAAGDQLTGNEPLFRVHSN
ncbi:hypothetical protein V8E55_002516 [Tylopilus felleus]